ncbi:hypothetical protein V6Z12_A01G219500 [Gossypium hirsutum]
MRNSLLILQWPSIAMRSEGFIDHLDIPNW